MTTTPALVAPKTCSRCKGEGLVSASVRRTHFGVPGLCFKCNGVGQVEGDRATLAAQKAERLAAEARWSIAIDWFQTQDADVRRGFDLLEALEPERAQKALRSIEAGHPGVAAALLVYYTPSNWAALEAKHGR